jgi:RND superfamily putative drug exporter
LHRVGRFAARNAVWVLAAWVVIAIGLVVVANSVGRPESDNVTLPGTDSQSATNLLDDKLPEQANGSVPIVLQSNASLAQGQNMQAVESTATMTRA